MENDGKTISVTYYYVTAHKMIDFCRLVSAKVGRTNCLSLRPFYLYLAGQFDGTGGDPTRLNVYWNPSRKLP